MELSIAIILSVIVTALSLGVGLYLRRYRHDMTEMNGTMVGMTLGMMTGIVVGTYIGAATDMFISNLVGVLLGLALGAGFGSLGKVMGVLDGGMGGVMGGMMGAMLGVMVRLGEAQVWITAIVMTLIWAFFHVGLIVLIIRSSRRQYAIDPVCEMKVDTATAKWVTQYKGHVIYFCAPGCKRLFDKAPDNYPITVYEPAAKA
jgi:YHS domain-containing protein